MHGYGSKLLTPDDHISKMFKKALRSIGADESKHFHSLRHTFAVRRLIQGTSIYDLKLLMGHKSVTTTEVYCNMNLKRVAQDFPTIVSSYVNEAKIGKKDTKINGGYIVALPMTYDYIISVTRSLFYFPALGAGDREFKSLERYLI